jgi:hypothetical protein
MREDTRQARAQRRGVRLPLEEQEDLLIAGAAFLSLEQNDERGVERRVPETERQDAPGHHLGRQASREIAANWYPSPTNLSSASHAGVPDGGAPGTEATCRATAGHVEIDTVSRRGRPRTRPGKNVARQPRPGSGRRRRAHRAGHGNSGGADAGEPTGPDRRARNRSPSPPGRGWVGPCVRAGRNPPCNPLLPSVTRDMNAGHRGEHRRDHRRPTTAPRPR